MSIESPALPGSNGTDGKSANNPDIGTKTIGVRVTLEYAAWLENLARHYRTTVAGVVDRALAEWTEEHEYHERPPVRTPQ